MKSLTELPMNIFAGRQIELLCFAEFNVYIHLSLEPNIIISTSIECINSNKFDGVLEKIMPYLHKLLGESIEKVEIDCDKSLILSTSTGMIISINQRYAAFENFTVQVGKELYL